jgi:hypothetical protein
MADNLPEVRILNAGKIKSIKWASIHDLHPFCHSIGECNNFSAFASMKITRHFIPYPNKNNLNKKRILGLNLVIAGLSYPESLQIYKQSKRQEFSKSFSYLNGQRYFIHDLD